MQDYSYVAAPFITWVIVGGIKFIINSVISRKLAFNLIGNGGFPSTHTAVVTSMAVLIAIKSENINNPSLGVAITLCFIVIFDALGLRKYVGKQAVAINKLSRNLKNKETLRERVGHNIGEVFAGVIVGVGVAFMINIIPKTLVPYAI